MLTSHRLSACFRSASLHFLGGGETEASLAPVQGCGDSSHTRAQQPACTSLGGHHPGALLPHVPLRVLRRSWGLALSGASSVRHTRTWGEAASEAQGAPDLPVLQTARVGPDTAGAQQVCVSPLPQAQWLRHRTIPRGTVCPPARPGRVKRRQCDGGNNISSFSNVIAAQLTPSTWPTPRPQPCFWGDRPLRAGWSLRPRSWDFPSGSVAKILCPGREGPGSIPTQGTNWRAQ